MLPFEGPGMPQGLALRSVKVKNTFIDDSDCAEDDLSGMDSILGGIMKVPRQVTEPPPITSKLLERSMDREVLTFPQGIPEHLQSADYAEPAYVSEEDSYCALPATGLSQDQFASAVSSTFDHGHTTAPPLPRAPPGVFPMQSLTSNAYTSAWPAKPVEPVHHATNPTSVGADMRLAVGALAAAHGDSNLLLAWNDVYTVMMRNLPNKVTQEMLLLEINKAGFLHAYDFVYLPIDPDTNANRGYAFINFSMSGLALMFRMHFEGHMFTSFNSDKVVSVVPAALQGFEANYAHYSSARVRQREPSARPLFLRETSVTSRKNGGHRPGSLIDAAAKQSRRLQTNEQHLQAPNALKSVLPYLHSGISDGYDVGAPAPASRTRKSDSADAGAGEAILPSDDAARRRPVPKFCPYCGGAISPGFKFCTFCGSAISFSTR